MHKPKFSANFELNSYLKRFLIEKAQKDTFCKYVLSENLVHILVVMVTSKNPRNFKDNVLTMSGSDYLAQKPEAAVNLIMKQIHLSKCNFCSCRSKFLMYRVWGISDAETARASREPPFAKHNNMRRKNYYPISFDEGCIDKFVKLSEDIIMEAAIYNLKKEYYKFMLLKFSEIYFSDIFTVITKIFVNSFFDAY